MQNESEAIIAKGIAAGDRVVTTGFARLKDGARVTVAAPEEATSSISDVKQETKSGGREARGIRTACAADVQKFCANVDRSQVRGCLQANAAQLSDACRSTAASSAKPREAEARKADSSSTQ
jgi:multidrug efflux system membrane fusion protein